MPKDKTSRKPKGRPKKKQSAGGASAINAETQSVKAQAPSKSQTEESTVLAALKKIHLELVDPVASTRHLACNTLAHIASEEKNASLIASSELIPRVVQCLQDEEPQIACEAAGCIRNLARFEDEGVVAALANPEFLSILVPACSTLITAVHHHLKLGEEGVQDHRIATTTLAQLFHAVWSLSEMNEVVAAAAAQELTSALVECMDPATFSLEVASVAAQCLQTLTEDSPAAEEAFRTDPLLARRLFEVLSEPGTLPEDSPMQTNHTYKLYILSTAGSVINLGHAATQEVLSPIILVISATLDLDLLAAFAAFTPQLANALKNKDDGIDSPARVELEGLLDALHAQQLGLELVANLLSSVEEQAAWEEVDEDIDDDEFEGEVEVQEGEEDVDDQTAQIAQDMVAAGLLGKISSKCLCMDQDTEAIYTGLAGASSILYDLYQLQVRALGAITNLTGTASLAAAPLDDVTACVNNVMALTDRQPAGSDATHIAECFNTMWAVLRGVLTAPATAQEVEVDGATLQRLGEAALTSEAEDVRVAAVGMIGCLSQLPRHQQHLSDFGTVLIHSTTSDNSGWVVAEALNSIFDGFAEDNAHQAFADAKMMSQLRDFVSSLSAKTRASRKKPDLYHRLDEARTNLKRFIKYKQQQLAPV
eukprot:m.142203 g.142203  ORF g.142203 m.142203 type:complete len:651 (-) comp14052_c0_seq1:3510-5462(-)